MTERGEVRILGPLEIVGSAGPVRLSAPSTDGSWQRSRRAGEDSVGRCPGRRALGPLAPSLGLQGHTDVRVEAPHAAPRLRADRDPRWRVRAQARRGRARCRALRAPAGRGKVSGAGRESRPGGLAPPTRAGTVARAGLRRAGLRGVRPQRGGAPRGAAPCRARGNGSRQSSSLGARQNFCPSFAAWPTRTRCASGCRPRPCSRSNRCGHQADALEVYAAARATLVEELGVEPGADLRDLQRRTSPSPRRRRLTRRSPSARLRDTADRARAGTEGATKASWPRRGPAGRPHGRGRFREDAPRLRGRARYCPIVRERGRLRPAGPTPRSDASRYRNLGGTRDGPALGGRLPALRDGLPPSHRKHLLVLDVRPYAS